MEDIFNNQLGKEREVKEYKFRIGDLVKHSILSYLKYNGNKYSSGIVIGKSHKIGCIKVKWMSGSLDDVNVSGLEILSKSSGEEIKIKMEDKKDILENQLNNKNNDSGFLSWMYGGNKQISNQASKMLQILLLIIASCVVICFMVCSISECNKEYARSTVKCVKETKKPLECKEAFKIK